MAANKIKLQIQAFCDSYEKAYCALNLYNLNGKEIEVFGLMDSKVAFTVAFFTVPSMANFYS